MTSSSPHGSTPRGADSGSTPTGDTPRDRAFRILFLDSWKRGTAEGSGTRVGIEGLAAGLRELGHEVEVLRPRSTGGALALRRLLFNLGLRRRIRRMGPVDLVVGFDMDGFLAGRHLEAPYVLCLKGVAADEALFASGFDRFELSLLARLERRNARAASVVIVPSRYSAGVAGRAYEIPDDRLRVVPEPLDERAFPDEVIPSTRNRAPTHPMVLSVAHQYPRKDTATLLRAFAAVVQRIPRARLRIIGGGPELPALRTLARELVLGDHVIFDGAVEEDAAVRAAYREADLFCLPSLQEGFGIVFLEAMAAGLPVVAARAGAAPEVIEDGVTGVLVPPRSAAELADVLLTLLGDHDRRRAMGEAGRRHARAFGRDRVAARFLEAAGAAPGPSGAAPVSGLGAPADRVGTHAAPPDPGGR